MTATGGNATENSTMALFSEVNFLIHGGERVGIIGPNGCGKTTLLNILLGRDHDYKGFARLGRWVKYAFLGQRPFVFRANRQLHYCELFASFLP